MFPLEKRKCRHQLEEMKAFTDPCFNAFKQGNAR